MRAVLLSALLASLLAISGEPEVPPPHELKALARQLRVDLSWSGDPSSSFEIFRSSKLEGPFEKVPSAFPNRAFGNDFLGTTSGDWFYKVRSIGTAPNTVSSWSETVKAAPAPLNPESLLTEVQEAGFRYFYDYAHPRSGLARESFLRNPDLCATGATGMGLFNLIVGVERNFIAREAAHAHALKMLGFLEHKAERFHGAFPHWLNGTTGKAIPFSRKDDGADLVETAFLIQGLLALREYFSDNSAAEGAIRAAADRIWRDVEWDWFVRDDNGKLALMWHWSPAHGWTNGLKISGFNEAQIAYLLGLASPTHPISAQAYWDGWKSQQYAKARTAFGITTNLCMAEPPLFFTHYSYLGLDPRTISFGQKSYFEHFQNMCRVQVRYAESKRDEFSGYGTLWGITSSYGPDGYCAFHPFTNDNGTLAPTASLSSIPYVPDESRACLVEMYQKHGKTLWGPFGFYDAFNLSRNWVSKDVLGIDVGPIAPMIENYRTGLCWKMFMKAHEIGPVLKIVSEAGK